MKQSEEMTEYDQSFKSIHQKIGISDNEQRDVLHQLNIKLDDRIKPNQASSYKYYLSLVAVGALLVLLFLLSILQLSENRAHTPQAEVPNTVNEVLPLLKEELKLGDTQSEVKELLGSDYAEIISAKYNEEGWRYDIETITGYSYSDETDFADLEGLRNGDVKMQVWITWNEKGFVKSFSTVYVNDSDKKIYDYRVIPDGEVRETPILDMTK